MLSRMQLLLLGAMALAGGSLSTLLIIGIYSGDFEMAAFAAAWIAAMFVWIVFTDDTERQEEPKTETDYMLFPTDFVYISSGSTRRCGDIHVGGDVHEEFK